MLLKLIKEPVSHMHMRPSITGIKKSNSHVPSVYVSERLILQQKRLFLPVADPEKKKNPQIIRFQNAVLTADLKVCFPDSYKKLLSIAYYLILEDNNPLYRFEKWNFTHKHPYGADISSPRSSEFFSSITDEQINKFFRLQGKRRVDDEYWAYDSTSISSYSETLAQVQYGKNKEDDKLPQLNLLLVFGEESGLPFYYRKLAGNIPDSKTVKHLLEDLDILGFGKTKFVMDRGFYSEDNINGLYREHVKFLVGVKLSLNLWLYGSN